MAGPAIFAVFPSLMQRMVYEEMLPAHYGDENLGLLRARTRIARTRIARTRIAKISDEILGGTRIARLANATRIAKISNEILGFFRASATRIAGTRIARISKATRIARISNWLKCYKLCVIGICASSSII